MQKIKNSFVICLYIGMSAVFFMLCIILLNNPTTKYTELVLVPLVCLVLLVLVKVWNALKKHEAWLEKNYRFLLVGFLVFFFCIYLLMNYFLAFSPIFDLGAIYNGAIEWVETGSFSSYYTYFERFHTNWGELVLFYMLFSLLNLMEVHSYFAAAAVVNSIGILCTMALCAWICKKKLGTTQAVFVLVLFLISPPFYFMSPVIYTDCFSLLYPVLFYALYLKAGEYWGGKVFLYGILAGVSMGIGMNIKMSVAIMLIAVIVDSFLHQKPFVAARFLLGSFGGMICMLMLVPGIIYGFGHLDREADNQNKLPLSYTVMVGLNQKYNGRYNSEDKDWMYAIVGIEEKEAATWREIKNRLKEMGVDGLNDHIINKIGIDFNGTYGLSDFLDDNPLHRFWLHEWILYDGHYYVLYSHFCQAVYIAILLLLTLSAVIEVLKEKTNTKELLAPRLAIMGLCMMLALWEASQRYASNFVPIMFLGAVMGIQTASDIGMWIKKNRRKNHENRRLAQ